MYSAAMSKPREGVRRPSSASDAINERRPLRLSALTRSMADRSRGETEGCCAKASAEKQTTRASAPHARRRPRVGKEVIRCFCLGSLTLRTPSLTVGLPTGVSRLFDLDAFPEGDAAP